MREFLDSIGYDRWILLALLALPTLAAIGIWVHGAVIGNDADARERGSGAARHIALWAFVLEFLLSTGLWWSFDASTAAMQATLVRDWIPSWGVRFALGIDGIALMMILLTTFLMPLAALGSWTSIRGKRHSYYSLLLLLTTGMLGVFMARDLFLFYVMWEMMLVPMYFIIGIWGGERRLYASIKFFVYTMIGSLLMLVAIVWLGIKAGGATPDFSYDAVLRAAAASGAGGVTMFGTFVPASVLMFLAFALAFAVKVPMFPFHTWLPDAHVEAPTAGSVILAGIMLKMGTYGFIRFALPLFPDAAMSPGIRTTFLVLGVIGVLYGALVAMVQPDFKKLVAYSSVSHLGFVMLGIFALTTQSVQGALMIMINHGISTGALFLLIGMIYERRHTREIEAYGGIARTVPLFAALLTFVSLSSIGLPGTNGFVGEFLVLLGSFRTAPWLTTIAATGVIFAAAYLLWAIQRILFNSLDKPVNEHIPDLNGREIAIMVPLVVVILWLGLYPAPVLRRMEASAEAFVSHVSAGAATSVARAP
ncbi:MAG TPA: NADH-quinone oxidoreductase subunit M [Gemmatimonadaceae bacterium]|nr:NADH-quinone oxidoreductase subunit M [Gemmatimonadaceae bacterium]